MFQTILPKSMLTKKKKYKRTRQKRKYVDLPLSSLSFSAVFSRRQAPSSCNDSENSERKWEYTQKIYKIDYKIKK